jgi:hypothetical protein
MSPIKSNSFEERLKSWLAPILMVIVGWYTSTTINEIKADVKILLQHDISNTERTKYLEIELKTLREQKSKVTSYNTEATLQLFKYEAEKTKMLVYDTAKHIHLYI